MCGGRLTCEVGIVLWVNDDRVKRVVRVNIQPSAAELHMYFGQFLSIEGE